MLRSATITCVSFLVVVGLVSSCRTPAATTTTEITEQRKDSVIVTEKIREVLVEVPGDSIPYAVQIECDEKTNKPKPMRYSGRSGRASNVMEIDSTGLLKGTASCDSIAKMVEVKDREILHLKEYIRTEKQKTVTPVFKTRRIDIIARWIAGICIVVIIFKIKNFLTV